jgi:glycosyltransferase involved in cell wall biosynthesis
MTAGMSLAVWDELGVFEREVELYRRLRPHLASITLVTYGGNRDLRLGDRLPGISILCNQWRLPGVVHRWRVGRLFGGMRSGRLVVKSNQMQGADVALRAALSAGGAFVARCGYMLSDFTARTLGAEHPSARADRKLEARVFRCAQRCVVTTESMAATVAAYGVERERVHVIPNYVDTERLSPAAAAIQSARVCFVGRFDEQKNLFALVDSMAGIDAELVLVGDGPQAEALRARAAERGVRAEFTGRVPHAKLADVINGSSVFVLPSHFEGHPKALLEAMSCGAAVLATEVPGIREVVRHGETGWLCGTGAADLAAGLRTLLADPPLRARLGRAAREQILYECALDRVVDLELDVIRLAAEAASTR